MPSAPVGDASLPVGDASLPAVHDAGVAPNHPGPDAAAAPCSDVLAVIGPAIEAARVQIDSVDVGVGVATATCPFVQYLSGPSMLDADVRFRVASITKTYTAAVILHFVAKGLVGLDDTVAKFSLGIPAEAQITVRQLLDHTSGLFNYTDDPTYSAHLDWTPSERLTVAAKNPAYFAPGQGWHYSNTNFVALGLIAEHLGGAPLAALIRTTVLEPRGLTATYLDGTEPVVGTIAAAFAKKGTPSVGGRFGAGADGAMVATLDNVTRWMRAFASGDATPTLKKDLLAGIPEPGVPAAYGLGLEILSPAATGDVAAYGHSGDLPGFHSIALYFPAHDWTITAIVNTDSGDPGIALGAVLDALRAAKK